MGVWVTQYTYSFSHEYYASVELVFVLAGEECFSFIGFSCIFLCLC